jgi:hypothetical protein
MPNLNPLSIQHIPVSPSSLCKPNCLDHVRNHPTNCCLLLFFVTASTPSDFRCCVENIFHVNLCTSSIGARAIYFSSSEDASWYTELYYFSSSEDASLVFVGPSNVNLGLRIPTVPVIIKLISSETDQFLLITSMQALRSGAWSSGMIFP